MWLLCYYIYLLIKIWYFIPSMSNFPCGIGNGIQNWYSSRYYIKVWNPSIVRTLTEWNKTIIEYGDLNELLGRARALYYIIIIREVRDEQLLKKTSNSMRLTLFMTLHLRDQMGYVSSYFLLTCNQHPTHLTLQKELRVTPDIFV